MDELLGVISRKEVNRLRKKRRQLQRYRMWHELGKRYVSGFIKRLRERELERSYRAERLEEAGEVI